jgi:hypothetical protein
MKKQSWTKERFTAVSKYGTESGLDYVSLVEWLGSGLDIKTVTTIGADLRFKYQDGEEVTVLAAAKIRPTIVKMLMKHAAA